MDVDYFNGESDNGTSSDLASRSPRKEQYVDKEFLKDSQGRAVICREIILQKYPQQETELPTQTPPHELEKILFSYLELDVPELFVNRITQISTEILNDGQQERTKMTYLHLACERNHILAVDALLKKNVHLNELVLYFNPFEQIVTPIKLAAFKGHYEIFEKLLLIPQVELQNAGGGGSVLHLVLHGMHGTQDRNRSTQGHRMILGLLLDIDKRSTMESRGLNIEYTDMYNRTALHYAIKFNNEFAIKLLLRAGAKLYPKDRSVLTLISATILEGYFDDCICSSRESIRTRDDVDNPIIFHYEIFAQINLYSIATKSKGSFCVRFESFTEMRKLYKHPLTKSLLYLKWRLVRKYYYINLAFYSSFCFALSEYIFQIQDRVPLSDDFNNSASTETDAANNLNASSILCDVSLRLWLATLLLYIVLILRELCQFSVTTRSYFGIPENWLEITTIVVIGFLFANETNTQLAASAILTSWIGLILLLGKQPSLSIYIEMFKKVALNFAKFLLLYSILVASFAYSFFILFRNASSATQTNVNATDWTTENYRNLWRDTKISFFKSFIMMTGEFETSTLPLDSNFSYGHLFFILFVFLVTMVLYNLLNGLAVSDTRAIMEEAEEVALMCRAKLISQIERLAISNPFRHVFKRSAIKPLERGYSFLRNKVFGDKIRIDETKPVYVYPAKNNRIQITGRNFGKMPSKIVKHAEQILEKRKQSKQAQSEDEITPTNVTKNNASGSGHQSLSEQISNLKLEIFKIDAKIAAREEKLLQNVDKRLDKINKLLESVLQNAGGKSSEEHRSIRN